MDRIKPTLSVRERTVIAVRRFGNLADRLNSEIRESADDLLARVAIAGEKSDLAESRLSKLESLLDQVDPKVSKGYDLRYDEAAGM